MILIIIVVILVAGLGGMWALASFESAHAEALKAQALITANQTTQVSVIGQTVVSIVLAVVVLAILAAIVIGLWLNKISQTRQAQTGQWLPGPNARWQSRQSGLIANPADPSLRMSPQALLLQQQMMQQQILMMWLMRQMGTQPQEMAALPDPQHSPEVEADLPWWD